MSRKDMLKVYHGLPKNSTDEHTVLYASLDGAVTPEIGTVQTFPTVSYSFKSTVTGTGLCLDVAGGCYTFITSRQMDSDQGSIDFWINPSEFKDEAGWSEPITVLDSQDNVVFNVCYNKSAQNLYFVEKYTDGSERSTSSASCLILDHNEKNRHVRVCWDNTRIYLYSNGKLMNYGIRYDRTIRRIPGDKVRIGRTATTSNTFKSTMSDVKVSNVNLAGYFPNLPQDFIDGKAIIMPRMGQQQIKGDPMYNQEITDIIRIGTEINEPYITCSRITGNWTSGDTIKIKGLSGEVISGVIDVDTALCKVTKNNIQSDDYIPVSDTSALTVGDSINFFVPPNIYYFKNRTVTEINSELSSIKVTPSVSLGADGHLYHIVETTASSSSPIVKTSNGTVITGTWSNLGTNEATFTLGANTALTNQELYVTYSLNIPAGNSDFTELPYSIDKVYDSLGNDLVKVSGITIEDDFLGKKKDDYEICPHYSSIKAGTTLFAPSAFPKDDYITEYAWMSSRGGDMVINANPGGQTRLQQLFAFNLIEMFERKIGVIPSRDKVQWLRDNLTKIRFTHYGFAKNSANIYKINIASYRTDTQEWVNPTSHSNSTITAHSFVLVSNSAIKNYRIDDNGYVYFNIYTDPADSSIAGAQIATDYVSLEINLPTEDYYDIFFSNNKRAREMPCNPVLIQKETKTVKRYLPSKECFVTECKYDSQANRVVSSSVPAYYTLNKLALSETLLLTSYGTGNPDNVGNDNYKNSINHIYNGFKSYQFCKDAIKNQRYPHANKDYEHRLVKMPCCSTNDSPWFVMPNGLDSINMVPFVLCKPLLIKDNGEIKMCYYTEGWNTSSQYRFITASLPNRPLIK